jgi:drug/metabolite transporter (DMT)-like permease
MSSIAALSAINRLLSWSELARGLCLRDCHPTEGVSNTKLKGTHDRSMRREFLAKLACLFGGAAWGIFWIPLRRLEADGIPDLWGTALFFAVPAILLLPLVLLRHRQAVNGGIDLQLTAFAGALSLAFYAVGVVLTDVIRAMLLFYMTPLWSALLGRIVLKQRITAVRTVTMTMALAGMLTMFGLGQTWPVPRNAGDWMGLGAGVFWAVYAVRLRQDQANSALDLTVWNFLWCALLAVTGAWFTQSAALPDLATLAAPLPWLVPVALLLVLPCALASSWGPKHIDPALVGILFMTEITVGGITAALWAGEPFGLRELAGVLLISGAALVDSLWDLWQVKKAAGAVERTRTSTVLPTSTSS